MLQVNDLDPKISKSLSLYKIYEKHGSSRNQP